MTPGLYKQQPRVSDQNYNLPRNSYVQQDQEPQPPPWHHHQQGEMSHHPHHQQMRYNGSGYPTQTTPQPHPMNRVSYNGTPGPSRFDQHHQQQMHHHQQHYSPILRGQATPHRSPRALHQPLQGRPPPSASYQQSKAQDKGRGSPQNYQQPHESGRLSPTIYQLGKPPPETPPPSQIHQLVKQPPDVKSSPLTEKRHDHQSTSSQPEQLTQTPSTSTMNAPQINQERPAPAPLKKVQSNSQDTLDSGQSSQLSETVIHNSTEAEVKTHLPEDTPNASTNNQPSSSQQTEKQDKKAELTTTQRLSKLNLDQEDDDEGII